MKKDREEKGCVVEDLLKKIEHSACSVLSGMEHPSSWGPKNVATSTNTFGCTSITQHRIITGESKSIMQTPRQLPLDLREKAEEV